MSGYSTSKKDYNRILDLTKMRPYGDTYNDGMVQVSFTLPVTDNDRSIEAAKLLAQKMGIDNPSVVCHKPLDNNYSFYIVYGNLKHWVNYEDIKVQSMEDEIMNMYQVNEFIKTNINRKIVVIGASTGTDAHTVGIDAILNMKGYAGHYGLERYDMIEVHNLGSQVPNHEFARKAIELNADVLLVSQTVTQKGIHIKNLTNLVEILEAEGIRDKMILICGGPRITFQLAKEVGYDAGFGPGKFAEDVATFAVKELVRRRDSK